MTKTIYLLLGSLIMALVLAAQPTPKVLIIGVDGCRPDALEVAQTPNLDALIATGLYSPDALNDDVTVSGPGWSAITTGVWSDQHGVTDNSFANSNYERYPHFYRYVENFDSTLQTVSFCHWGPINDQIVQGNADFKLNLSTDAEVARVAADYLRANDPDVVFLHFDDTDAAGHGSGFSPDNPNYLAAIEVVDDHIGQVVAAVRARPNYAQEDWLIVSTTDHGGLGRSHGGTSLEEERVYFLLNRLGLNPQVLTRDTMVLSEAPENCLDINTELYLTDGAQVAIAPDSLWNFGTDRDFTIECRVRTATAADVSIVGNKDWNSGVNKGFVFSFRFASGPEWKVNIGDGSNRADLNVGGEIADQEWYTLSVSFDRDGLMKMYQDGQLLDSIDISNIGDVNTDAGLLFGTDINGGYRYDGALAEVRVWDGAIDGSTIADWHCRSIDNAHPNQVRLLGYWPLAEGMDTVATDASGREHHGVIREGQWRNPEPILEFDFSETPRLVDVVPTVLAHLCIPQDPAWALAGRSWLEACEVVSTDTPQPAAAHLYCFPSPATDQLQVRLERLTLASGAYLTVYDIAGQELLRQPLTETTSSVDVSTLPAGIYFLRLNNQETIITTRFLKSH